MADEGAPYTGGWTNDMLEGMSTQQKLGLFLQAVGGQDLSPLLKQAESRRKEGVSISEKRRTEGRGEVGARAGGGALADISEAEGSGDLEGALRMATGALRHPNIGLMPKEQVGEVLRRIPELEKRGREKKALTRLREGYGAMTQGGALASPQAMNSLVLEALSDAGVGLDKGPGIAKWLTERGVWKDAGEVWKVYQPDGVTLIMDVPKVKTEKSGEDIYRFEGGQVKLREVRGAPKMAPAEHGGELPGSAMEAPPQGMYPPPGQSLFQPISSLVAPAQAPGREPIAPRVKPKEPVETPLSTEQRQILADSPFKSVRTFEELARQGGGETLQKGILDVERRRREDAQADAMARQASMTTQLAERDAQRRDAELQAPIGRKAIQYANAKTFRAPDGLTPTSDVLGDPQTWIQVTTPDLAALRQTSPIRAMLDEWDSIIERRQDLYPKASGKGWAWDRGRVELARLAALAKAGTDKDLQRIKQLSLALPLMIKQYGDTGNISGTERLYAADAFPVLPTIGDAAQAQVDLARKLLNAKWITQGFAGPFHRQGKTTMTPDETERKLDEAAARLRGKTPR